MEIFYTYILYSVKLDKFYIGSTGDLERRLEEHNRGKGSYTRSGIPWQLVFSEQYQSKKEAVTREMEIKKRKSKAYIQKLIG